MANLVANIKSSEGSHATNTDLWRTSVFLAGVGLCGAISLALWSLSLKSGGLTGFAFGLLLMAGAGLVGGVIGLLFGIPKSVSELSSEKRQSGENGDTPPPGYATNTNLEQISDWLTKILVGVGLTEIATIRDQFSLLATYLGDGFLAQAVPAAGTAAPTVAAVIVVFGLTSGFIAGYLFTRIFLTGAFVRVDESLRERFTALTKQVKEEREFTDEAARLQGEIYQDLYRYDEEGFRRAIEKLNELLVSPANQRNPALWVYLAAAQGQAYRWEIDHPSEKSERKDERLKYHRGEALRAVERALSLGDNWKPVLQQMWNKHSPLGAQGEDDLQVFYDDEDFRKLLGA